MVHAFKPALRRLRLEGCEFKVSLGNLVRYFLQKKEEGENRRGVREEGKGRKEGKEKGREGREGKVAIGRPCLCV